MIINSILNDRTLLTDWLTHLINLFNLLLKILDIPKNIKTTEKPVREQKMNKNRFMYLRVSANYHIFSV